MKYINCWLESGGRLGVVVVAVHGIDLSDGSLDIGGEKRWLRGTHLLSERIQSAVGEAALKRYCVWGDGKLRPVTSGDCSSPYVPSRTDYTHRQTTPWKSSSFHLSLSLFTFIFVLSLDSASKTLYNTVGLNQCISVQISSVNSDWISFDPHWKLSWKQFKRNPSVHKTREVGLKLYLLYILFGFKCFSFKL